MQETKKTQMQSLGQQDPLEDGNPLLYSCLGNPMNTGAWWTTVHGIAWSWTQLNWAQRAHSTSVNMRFWSESGHKNQANLTGFLKLIQRSAALSAQINLFPRRSHGLRLWEKWSPCLDNQFKKSCNNLPGTWVCIQLTRWPSLIQWLKLTCLTLCLKC